MATAIQFPSSFFESGKKYICRANGCKIIIASDSTGKDQLSYDVNTRAFESLRKIVWATPTHRKELEDAFLAAYLEMPIQDAPIVETKPMAPAQPKAETITIRWNDNSLGHAKGEIFENKPGQFLRVVSVTRRYIAEDGYSQGLGAEEGYLFTAQCVPATQEEISGLQQTRTQEAESDTFRTESSQYKVTAHADKTMSIRPYSAVSGGTMADTIGFYFPAKDTIEWRGIAECYQLAVEKEFRAWLKGQWK